MDSKRNQLRRAITLLSISAFLGILILMIVLSKMLFDVGVVCAFNELTGFYCPGCGGTRMAVALLSLDIYQAFRYNAFIVVTLPILVYVYVKQSFIFIVKNELISWLDKFLVTYAVALLVFGIIRNFGVFKYFAPTTIVN